MSLLLAGNVNNQWKPIQLFPVNEVCMRGSKQGKNTRFENACVVVAKENKDGVACVTEVNCGRFFTTSNFFTAAGSNMPYYHIKLAFGEELPKLSKYNCIPENTYWIRMVDMGCKLVKEGEWNFQKI